MSAEPFTYQFHDEWWTDSPKVRTVRHCQDCDTVAVERPDSDGHGYMLAICPNDDCPRIVVAVLS